MCDRDQCAEHCGVVQQTIQPSEFLVYSIRQIVEILLRRTLKIHRVDCGLGTTRRLNGIVDLFQVTYRFIQQHHMGTIVCTAFGDSSTDAVAGTGNQDDAVFKKLVFRLPVAGYVHGRILASVCLEGALGQAGKNGVGSFCSTAHRAFQRGGQPGCGVIAGEPQAGNRSTVCGTDAVYARTAAERCTFLPD